MTLVKKDTNNQNKTKGTAEKQKLRKRKPVKNIEKDTTRQQSVNIVEINTHTKRKMNAGHSKRMQPPVHRTGSPTNTNRKLWGL
jgi:hypothetical protein